MRTQLQLHRRDFLAGSLATSALALAPTRAAAYKGCGCGVVAPLTGPVASVGQQIQKGADQAVKDINARGFETILATYDDGCDPGRGANAARALIDRDKAVFVFGHLCTAIPAAAIYESAKVLHITPSAGIPAGRSPPQNYVFRIVGKSDAQAEVAGMFLASQFASGKIGILYADSAFGKAMAETIRKAMNSKGVREAVFAGYPPGATDFMPFVTQMKSIGVDVFYVAGSVTDAGRLIVQARRTDFGAQMVTGNVLAATDFWKVTGAAGKGTLMVSSADPSFSPTSREVAAKLKANGVDPRGYTLYAYAAMQVWAQTVLKIGNDDPTQVAKTLHDAGEVDTVIGRVSFDQSGELNHPRFALYTWSEGTYVQTRQLT